MSTTKHIIRYSIYAAIITGLAVIAGITTWPLLVAFLTRFAMLCLSTAVGVTIYDIVDHTVLGAYNTAEELKKGNIAIAIMASVLIAVLIVAMVFGF